MRSSNSAHIAQFYESEEFLCDVLARFVNAGLKAGEPAVVIAGERRRRALAKRLQLRGHDVEAASRAGQIALVDARETLSQVMGPMPDRDRFHASVGALIAASAARAPSGRVRAFSEMADVLWREGELQAAMRVEELWNELQKNHSFSVLCSYAMGSFYKEAHAAQWQAICQEHSRVAPTEAYCEGENEDARLCEVARLQQQARALGAEVQLRRKLENALRESLGDLRRSEKALAENEEELRDFTENAPEGLDRIGPDGIILWANKAKLDLLGYSGEEYVGRHAADFHVDRAVMDDILARLGRNETVRNREARLRAKDGSIREVLVSANALTREGKFIHARCFTKDITAQRELERVSQAAAREADRRKDEFLAMLGHELRNPLAPILTGLQLLRAPGTEAQRANEVIERQIRHLARLVDDLLDVSRITRGKVRLEKGPVELAVVIAKAVEMANPLYDQRHHVLEVEAPGEGLLVEADQFRLAQVFANLLTNAAKYTDPGGRVEVTGRREGRELVVSVKDSGIGIAPDMLPKVFDLFVQGERGADRSQGGLGIGLTIARSLVELHGGTIAARSAGLGAGSEFVVRLPALEAPAAAQSPPEAPRARAAAGGSKLRILLVDDNTDAAEILAQALRGSGHEVAVAHDGARALSIAPTFQPNAALLDIGLPGMDGYQLAAKLREVMGARPPRLVALTGYGQSSDRAKSRQAGFDAHLVKPVDLDAILAVFAHGS